MSGSISLSVTKLLWGRNGNRCSMPDCRRELIAKQTGSDPPVPVGEMAHIAGKKLDSPRYDSAMSDAERNSYDNLILLCPSCHTKVDRQVGTYTVKRLHQIKQDHVMWIASLLKRGTLDVTFVELETVANYIASGQAMDDDSYDLVAPKDKICRNSLSEQIEGLIKIGMSRSKEVKRYLDSHPDMHFGSRLSAGFVAEYHRQKDLEISGDALFLSLLDHAAGSSVDNLRRAAGLVVLVYLFEACEVFER